MERIYINDNWLFANKFKEHYISGAIDEAFSEVRIPHTVKEVPFNYFSEEEYQMISAYRRVIFAPDNWLGKQVLLTIEGAAHYAEVYLNEKKIGEHCCGYTAFTIDLSSHLRYGEDNILIIKLDSFENLNIPPFGNVIDYMTFGGIYRDVYLEIKAKTYIKDVFVKPDITGSIVSDISLNGENLTGLKIRQSATLIGEEKEILLNECDVTKNEFTLNGFIENVKLWDIKEPNRYLIKTELVLDGKIIDTNTVKVGFRQAKFTKDGFYLNNERVQIRGLNRHQSYPYVGYAMPESMQREDARALKKCGVNAVRTSHYPQSHYFIDECDRLGLLVFCEIPGWQHIGDEKWKEQAIKNTEEMVLQYRNHPSIIIWGVRINESKDDHDFYVRTNAASHKLDPTRPTGGVRNFKKSELLEDVYTFNEFRHDGIQPGCYPKKTVTSDINKPYLITENNGHMFPTKSFDCENHRVEHALRHARVLNDVAANSDICGSFAWCMADYNTHKDFGSGDRICYHGVMDMFRNQKIASAVYSSQEDEIPVLEVSSSMDVGENPASIKGGVWVFTNADSVRMYKNDLFIKEYIPRNNHFPSMVKSPILIDDYIGEMLIEKERFSPKKAKALAKALNYIAINGYTKITPTFIRLALKCILLYRMRIDSIVDLYTKYIGDWGGKSTVYRFDAIKNGEVVKSVTKAPMSKAILKVTPSSDTLSEKNSYDVCLLSLSAVDENGNLLNYFNEPVKITVDGPLEVIGPDLTSLRGGMGGFYLKTVKKTGSCKVKLSCPQCEEVEIEIEIK